MKKNLHTKNRSPDRFLEKHLQEGFEIIPNRSSSNPSRPHPPEALKHPHAAHSRSPYGLMFRQLHPLCASCVCAQLKESKLFEFT
ncbi:MAG: hypothetical protein LBU32_31740 [Clostridiales bacterium]|nr:hypothetical protein [Clostridiales bacterium]